MAVADKALGLHQRIPFDIFNEAFKAELNRELDLERISELINTEYTGKNRQKKGLHQVKTTLLGNPLVEYCRERKDDVLSALKSVSDRNLILSAVIATRYPFVYDLFCALAKQFRIQDKINTDLILRMMGTKYGANKSVYNVQINAVAQMVDAGLITRAKVGVYEFGEPQKTVYEVTRDVWFESYFVNEPLMSREDTEGVLFEPYFRYLKWE